MTGRILNYPCTGMSRKWWILLYIVVRHCWETWCKFRFVRGSEDTFAKWWGESQDSTLLIIAVAVWCEVFELKIRVRVSVLRIVPVDAGKNVDKLRGRMH